MKAWLALTVLLLAGCTQPTEPDFDGDAAWQYMHDFVYDGEELRPRAPEDNRAGTIAWLHAQMDVPGWTVTSESFVGSDVTEEMATVAEYPLICSQADRDAVPNLQLTNLYATTGSGPHIMLGAHWDAKEDAADGGRVPAANDGASGVGVLLQLQRELTDVDYRVTIAFFDAEDGFEDCHPLWGSIYHANYLELPDAFILLDMVGDESAKFVQEERNDASIQRLIWDTAAERGMEQFTTKSLRISDDHLPFVAKGVPSVDIIDAGHNTFQDYWHTSEDTPDKLSPTFMGEMGDLLVTLLHSEELGNAI